jgi:ATP-dependent helicase/nuclease subunit B
MQATAKSAFTSQVLASSLEDFVETLVGWMRKQYLFDPVKVEWPFGEEGGQAAWEIELRDGRRLALRGRIDRVDVWRDPATGRARCVVVDYKSSEKKLDELLIAHGLQLQLLSYLNAVRDSPNQRALFGAEALEPVGVFYVSLRGQYENQKIRSEALKNTEELRKLAYQHSGRFDVSALRQLDARPEAQAGDQFNYRLKKDGEVNKNSREAMASDKFGELLNSVERNLRRMGDEVYAGAAAVDPYRHGTSTACEHCDYRAICRIDPWTHVYRVLRQPE